MIQEIEYKEAFVFQYYSTRYSTLSQQSIRDVAVIQGAIRKLCVKVACAVFVIKWLDYNLSKISQYVLECQKDLDHCLRSNFLFIYVGRHWMVKGAGIWIISERCYR